MRSLSLTWPKHPAQHRACFPLTPRQNGHGDLGVRILLALSRSSLDHLPIVQGRKAQIQYRMVGIDISPRCVCNVYDTVLERAGFRCFSSTRDDSVPLRRPTLVVCRHFDPVAGMDWRHVSFVVLSPCPCRSGILILFCFFQDSWPRV